MGRPRKQVLPVTQQAEPAVVVPAPTATEPQTVTMTTSDLERLISKKVNEAVSLLSTQAPISDDGYWQATCECQSEIFGCIKAEQVIRLSEDNERKLRLGKFAEVVFDQKTGKTITKTYSHLQKPTQFVMAKLMQMGEARAVEEGLLYCPPLTVNQSLDDKKPFRLLSEAK